ncbi:hypothetical protein [Rhodoflexus caldus]|uniref:hypothetical protein n=1 Tax=Rhodoflexus caldus TaxID=2891236 RepID=UPI002029D8C8|nr:hypothetical protein [Rhodoflexus caldus]
MFVYQFTLEVKDREELLFVEQVLRRLQVKFEAKPVAADTPKALAALRKIAERKVLVQQIPDAVQWQTEERQDRPMPFREL